MAGRGRPSGARLVAAGARVGIDVAGAVGRGAYPEGDPGADREGSGRGAYSVKVACKIRCGA